MRSLARVSAGDLRVLALASLCAAVERDLGEMSPLAIALVMVALAATAMSLVAGEDRTDPRRPTVALLCALGVTGMLYDRSLGTSAFAIVAAVSVAGILACHTWPRPGVRVAAIVASTASWIAAVFSTVAWGSASIDVFNFQQRATSALLHGGNPYSPLVASNMMTSPDHRSSLFLHFPYGPIIPLLDVPARALGDVRVTHTLAALVMSAAILVLARRSGTLERGVALVIAFPLTSAMVIFSWVDIITMAAFTCWVVLFRTHPRLAVLALAVTLAAKPTTLVALVPVMFWSARARRQGMVAAGLAALYVLPFVVITGVGAFYQDTVGVQVAAFPRLDSLTLNSYFSAYGLPVIPTALWAVLSVGTGAVILAHRPRNHGELWTQTAVLATVTFLLAKWAYLNYYYIPAVLLLLALAGGRLEVDDEREIRPPAPVLWVLRRVQRLRRNRPRSRQVWSGSGIFE